jgi:C-terminal processing protease CtpA/Prc
MSYVFIAAAVLISASAAQPAGTRLLRQPTISRNHVAFTYGGDLWVTPRSGRTTRRLTSTASVESGPRFSPDGRSLAFVRDGDVFLMDIEGAAERRLTWHPGSDRVLEWTADGRRLLISSDRLRGEMTGFPKLYVLDVDGGLPEPLPMPRAAHGSFSPDSSAIAYGPNPEITLWTPFKRYRGGSLGYIAVYDAGRNRYEDLPRGGANDVYPMWHGDNLYFVSDRTGTMNLYRYDLRARSTQQLTSYSEWDVKYPSRGPDAIVFENAGWLYTLDFASEAVQQIRLEVPGAAAASAEERETWQGALNEVWSKYAERAFRPWPGWTDVKPRYSELMKWAAHRDDAEYVLFEMLAEAGQSHAAIRWAGAKVVDQTGLLGGDYRVQDGRYRIARVYPDGPLASAGIREGQFILAVEGEPLGASEDIHARLTGRVGKSTRLTVGDGPATPCEMTVTPVADERHLRFTEWARRNAARVTEASGGKVGYVYVQNVDPPGVEQFRKQWKQLRLKVGAVIIDVRNNSGGRNPEDIYSWIGKKPDRVMYDFRGKVPPIGEDLDGPKVMLANDQSVSGGDELPYFFKLHRMGRLIGTRTLGGMIGSGATYKILGGWIMAIPEYGFFSPTSGEWYPDNYGVDPNERVELRPFALSGGREPQLERAIEVALEMLGSWQQRPEPPVYEPR